MKKREKNKEELKEYLKELSEKESLDSTDADKLTDMIDKLILGSKTERALALLSSFVLKFFIYYIVSLIASAFFLNQLIIDRYYIFLIAGGISLLLSIAEIISGLFFKKGLRIFVTSLFGILMIVLIYNNIIPTFIFNTTWIFYLILIEIIYNLLMVSIINKKFNL